jgi:hypothetical protein
MTRKAAKFRRRMIANPQLPGGSAVKATLEKREPRFKTLLSHGAARKGLKLFRRFWGLKAPERIVLMDDGKKSGLKFLVGLGVSNQLHLSQQDRKPGQKQAKGKRVVHGRWTVATDAAGRRILFLSGRAVKPPFRFVGYAPETHYIPTGDLERAGTHKRGRHWRHLHGQRDPGATWLQKLPESKLRWPKVYADRSGNYMYGTTPSSAVKDWMYG